MASVQCYKTCEQKNQHNSFGQKVADLFKGHHNNDHSNSGIQTQQTQCYSQTQVVPSHSGHGTAKTQTAQCSYTQTQTPANANNNTKCHGGRPRREHKRNLIQKIKDGLSGHSSDSGSSSESDSDNEGCQKRKNCN